uniref:Uncharacterized protein n=1 Tax=Chromera velia CCMP2878 TaxID=1169474 RepID=A0A0G4I410_9ALVE|eukprot:Cvel_10794.t1-p1 / transcript=Cvel_10794.t1 / gene=Cvel_10794 / organism=Chromera_velia_CCMP2878 / gene_product=Putative pseudouridine synthase C1A4.09, putative / transcript_product=Putative pseudouridine synthase C1A4.09, putative / location=Cvel_scaffold660:10410-22751(+) / protein_length=896 / sequence_SO=supercontig / SO=protein_coding / is_pseudo=false
MEAVGGEDSFVGAFFKEKVGDAVRLGKRVEAYGDLQGAFLLFRYCVFLKLIYLARVMGERISMNDWGRVDREMGEVFSCTMHLIVAEWVMAHPQAHFPLSHGSLGILNFQRTALATDEAMGIRCFLTEKTSLPVVLNFRPEDFHVYEREGRGRAVTVGDFVDLVTVGLSTEEKLLEDVRQGTRGSRGRGRRRVLKFYVYRHAIDTLNALKTVAELSNVPLDAFSVCSYRGGDCVGIQAVTCPSRWAPHLMSSSRRLLQTIVRAQRKKQGRGANEMVTEEGAKAAHSVVFGGFCFADFDLRPGMETGGDLLRVGIRFPGPRGTVPVDEISERLRRVEKFGFVNFFGQESVTVPGANWRMGTFLLRGAKAGFARSVLDPAEAQADAGIETEEDGALRSALEVWASSDGSPAATQEALRLIENGRKSEPSVQEASLLLQHLAIHTEAAPSSPAESPLDARLREAVEQLPFQIRQAHCKAYASKVWNELASLRIQMMGREVLKGDFFFPVDGDYSSVRLATDEDVNWLGSPGGKGVVGLKQVAIPLLGAVPENLKFSLAPEGSPSFRLGLHLVGILQRDGLWPLGSVGGASEDLGFLDAVLRRLSDEHGLKTGFRPLVQVPASLNFQIEKSERPSFFGDIRAPSLLGKLEKALGGISSSSSSSSTAAGGSKQKSPTKGSQAETSHSSQTSPSSSSEGAREIRNPFADVFGSSSSFSFLNEAHKGGINPKALKSQNAEEPPARDIFASPSPRRLVERATAVSDGKLGAEQAPETDGGKLEGVSGEPESFLDTQRKAKTEMCRAVTIRLVLSPSVSASQLFREIMHVTDGTHPESLQRAAAEYADFLKEEKERVVARKKERQTRQKRMKDGKRLPESREESGEMEASTGPEATLKTDLRRNE